MFGLGKYITGALSGLVAIFGALAWFYKGKSENATEAAREAERDARRNTAAREHVQETVEETREVEESNSRRTDDAVRRRLRDEYTASGGD